MAVVAVAGRSAREAAGTGEGTVRPLASGVAMKTKHTWIVALALALSGVVLAPRAALAQGGCDGCDRRPYGDYCDGPRWGRYGAKDPVRTAEEARKRLERFFADGDVTIGKITNHDTYYQAEIHDGDGELVDRVIIDKRTGRIRSIL